MKIGVNLSSSRGFEAVKNLIDSGSVDFCELLIDNFYHIPSDKVLESLAQIPISFHIMNSRFLEQNISELKTLASQLKTLTQALKPMYMSDHVAQYTAEGRFLPRLLELDYDKNAVEIISKADAWQDMLGTSLYLENFASAEKKGRSQAQFFQHMYKKTGILPLFDISNAFIAHTNCGASILDWVSLVSLTSHFHIGGYRFADSKIQLMIDSHDTALSNESIGLVQKMREFTNNFKGASLVVERDNNFDSIEWRNDIQRMRGALT